MTDTPDFRSTGAHYHIWLGGVLPPDLYDINDVNLLAFIRVGSCKIYLDCKDAMKDLDNFGGTRLDYTEDLGFEFRDFETAGDKNKAHLVVGGKSLASAMLVQDTAISRVIHEHPHGGDYTCQREIVKGVTYMATYARPKDIFTYGNYQRIMRNLKKLKDSQNEDYQP